MPKPMTLEPNLERSFEAARARVWQALTNPEHTVFSVPADSPIKTAQDLFDRLKANPEALAIGVVSRGGPSHLALSAAVRAAGIDARKLKTVVFKGSSEAITALLGSHIEIVSTGATNAAGHMAAGKLRVLGVSSGQRLPGAMATVPTWKEQGVDLVYGSWRSVVAPKGVTPEQVAFWESALRQVVESADWKAELERNYWGDFFMTGAEFRKTIDREYREMKGVLVELGLAKP